MISSTRRKVFISYHHKDQAEVEQFVNTFGDERDVFIKRILGMTDDIIDSNNTDYVMRRIREKYLEDSTVTICLIGKCTWSRRYVDWEIKSSLLYGNGLLGIILPSAGINYTLPERLSKNIHGENGDEGYASYYDYPRRKDSLAFWIDTAFNARLTKTHLIINPRDRFINNRPCS
jgi:hypothetical protein